MVQLSGQTVRVTRSVSPDGRYVCKSIRPPRGREYMERVRLFEPDEISRMLETAGVTVRHRFGDYDAVPLEPGRPRTILLGQVA